MKSHFMNVVKKGRVVTNVETEYGNHHSGGLQRYSSDPLERKIVAHTLAMARDKEKQNNQKYIDPEGKADITTDAANAEFLDAHKQNLKHKFDHTVSSLLKFKEPKKPKSTDTIVHSPFANHQSFQHHATPHPSNPVHPHLNPSHPNYMHQHNVVSPRSHI